MGLSPINNKKKYLDILAKLDETSLKIFSEIPAAKLEKLASKVRANPALVDAALSF